VRRANATRDEALLAGFEPRFAEARGVQMRYFVAGEGEPVVLVHGLTGAAANWVEVAPALTATRRVLVPDLPGHGGSGGLPAAPNLDAFAERVFLVMEHEAMAPAAIVGHSLGGVVALRLAIRRPASVAALVLAGSAGISSSSRWAEFWISLFGLTRPGRRLAPYRERIISSTLLRKAIFTRWQVADPRSPSADGLEALFVASPLHTDIVSAGEALVAEDPRPDLERVRCPALVLWGARDLQVRIDDAFEYARRLRAPLRTIADCGHLLIVERPDACVHAIEEFLDGVRQLEELPLEPEPLA